MEDPPPRPVVDNPVQNHNGCSPSPTAAVSVSNPTAPPPLQNRRSIFCHCFIPIASIVLIVIGTMSIILILWLVLHPRLPDFSIQSVSLSNFNAYDHCINATWNVQFRILNPNKKISISYEDVVSSVFHKDYLLTERRIKSFDQDAKNKRLIEMKYSVVDFFVEEKVVDELNGEKSYGEVRFDFKVMADVTFGFGGWRGRRRFLRVWCNDVVIASSEKMAGGPKMCTVV